MNTITVIGNVGKEPELRYTTSGKAVVTFAVADTRGKDDQKETQWHNVVCFDQQAENVAAQVTKGARVLVTGRLNKASFIGKDGTKKEKVEIVADDVCLSIKFGPRTERPASAGPSIVQSTFADEDPF